MKKSLLILALMLFSTLGFAQITKGNIQLGGSVAFFNTAFPDFKRANLFLRPRAGIFVSDLTSVGIKLQYSMAETNGFNSYSFEFGVYSRFHKMVSEKLYIYFEPSVSIGKGSDENITGSDTETNNFAIQVAPGMTYFISPKIALEMNLGALFYTTSKRDQPSGEITTNNYGLNLNLSTVSLGFSYFIKK